MNRSVALSLLLLCTVTACQRQEAPSTAPPTVLVQAVSRGDGAGRSYSGEIRARHEFDLAFRVGGKLAARLVDAGAEVKAGQVLARLDPADLQLAAEAARAQLAAANSDFATARSERERYAGLLTRKFVSQAAFDAKDNAFNSAAARLEQARAQSRISGNQAAYGSLAADVPAVVTAVLADAGQVVGAGQPVLRLARPEEKEVAIAVPEGQVAALKAARNIAVHLWAAPEIALTGQLREISPAADPASRTYAARIRLLDPAPGVQLGMTARVSLDAATDGPLHVPLSAVVDRGQGAQIWVVKDGKVEARRVRVARFGDDGVTLSEGVAEGDLVVVAGTGKLVAGQAVTPQPAKRPDEQR